MQRAPSAVLSKLSKPSRVASVLNWKGKNRSEDATILSLNFHRDRVGIAIASHPSWGIPCLELEPERFDVVGNDPTEEGVGFIRNPDCIHRFNVIVEEHNVCGTVVNWPLQHDTGLMGAACGRVLYALERLWELQQAEGGTSSGLFWSRPFCLWDTKHVHSNQMKDPNKRVDEFGRCPSYGIGSGNGGKQNQATATSAVSPMEAGLASDGDEISSSATADLHQILSSSTATTATTKPSSSSSPPMGSGLSLSDYRGRNTETGIATFTTTTAADCTDRCGEALVFHGPRREYFASAEQYHEDERTAVVNVWNDYCREHWPDLWREEETALKTSPPLSISSPSHGSGSNSSSRRSSSLVSSSRPRPSLVSRRHSPKLSCLSSPTKSSSPALTASSSPPSSSETATNLLAMQG